MNDQKIRNMEEFAAVSGLSRPTVSKYFNDPDSVRSSTRSRIEEALERYDFRPNIYAVNQNRRLTKNIGIVVPYLADPVFAEHARSIEPVRRCGVPPDPAELHGDSDQEVDNLESLRSLKPAGRAAGAAWAAPRTRARSSASAATCRPCCSTAISRGWAMRLSWARTTSVSSIRPWNTCAARVSRRASSRCADAANPNANKRRVAYIEAMERHGESPWWSRGGRRLGIRGNRAAGRACGHRGGATSRPTRSCAAMTAWPSGSWPPATSAGCGSAGDRAARCGSPRMTTIRSRASPAPSLTTAAHDYDAMASRSLEKLFEVIENGESTGTAETVRRRTWWCGPPRSQKFTRVKFLLTRV
jgi:transcriptional regulator with XRE-family HTH domain